jgi:hypothetical protein
VFGTLSTPLELIGGSFLQDRFSSALRCHISRPGEELNLASLADWLLGKIEGGEQGVTVEQFPGGHSNLTYLLRMNGDGREYVLRRGPVGPVAPKAHDMAFAKRAAMVIFSMRCRTSPPPGLCTHR